MSISGIGTLLVFLVLSLGAGGIGSHFTAKSVRTWYPTIRKPSWTPPNWLFAPVWTVIYIFIAISGWLIWNHRETADISGILFLYVLQLILNTGWSGLFFGLKRPGLALSEILILWIIIGTYTVTAWSVSLPAALLFLPYWIWVTFATALNGAVWWLNRGES